jgi:hypothetical protein
LWFRVSWVRSPLATPVFPARRSRQGAAAPLAPNRGFTPPYRHFLSFRKLDAVWMDSSKYIHVFGCYKNLDAPPHHSPIRTWLRQDSNYGLGRSLTTPNFPARRSRQGAAAPLAVGRGFSPLLRNFNRGSQSKTFYMKRALIFWGTVNTVGVQSMVL